MTLSKIKAGANVWEHFARNKGTGRDARIHHSARRF
jgi:hypothetical protein